MAGRGSEVRPIVKLRSTAGAGFTYVTRQNRRDDPDRMVLRTFDPAIRRHVDMSTSARSADGPDLHDRQAAPA